jgi:hypothetical protein
VAHMDTTRTRTISVTVMLSWIRWGFRPAVNGYNFLIDCVKDTLEASYNWPINYGDKVLQTLPGNVLHKW